MLAITGHTGGSHAGNNWPHWGQSCWQLLATLGAVMLAIMCCVTLCHTVEEVVDVDSESCRPV